MTTVRGGRQPARIDVQPTHRASETGRTGGTTDDGEAGVAAGLEALALGVLVFVVGTLVVLNAWSVVDAKLAVEAAAREGARAVVESAPRADGDVSFVGSHEEIARSAALSVLSGLRGEGSLEPGDDVLDLLSAPMVTGSLRRGGCVRVTLRVEVPVVALPLVGGRGGSRTVTGSHAERVDPYRAGLSGDRALVATPCPS